MSSLPKSWECSFPGCDKRFTRKEHLNRHKLGHNPEHQYKCPVCGRRYARSDVFKRHVKQHNPDVSQPPDTRRICLPCGERSTQCDGNSPCGACASSWIECRWVGSEDHHEASIESAIVLPASGPSQATWLPPTPEGWNSGPFPATPSYPEASNDLNLVHEENGTLGQAGLVHSTSSASAARFEPTHFNTSNITHTPLQQTSPPITQPQTTSESPRSAILTDSQTTYLDTNSPNTKRLVELFFQEIHPYWAILHAPTFELEKTPPVLLASMVILASWLEKGPDHKNLAPILFDEVARIRMVPHPPLHLLQAVLLYIVYTTCMLTTDGMVAKALNLTGLLVSTCRYLGVFNGQYSCHEMSGLASGCPFVAWRIQEQLNRLAFSVLRIDAYLSMLLDHPPSVRYQELWIPLPKSSQLWAASNEPERRELQWNEPAGREKALFSFFMRDALNPNRGKLPYCLTDIDYHLSTCATQTTIWELAREAHSSMSDELAEEINPGIFVDMAHPHLTLWRDKRKQDCPLLEQYFSGDLYGPEHILAPLTFTLMYMSTLKMFAPMNVLRIRGHYYKSRPGAAIPTRKPQAHLLSWVSTGCPRAALWNAAQICRIFTIESARSDCDSRGGITCPLLRTRLRLNPLLIPGVLMSAIVACSYARLKGRCANCRSDADSPGASFSNTTSDEVIDLFEAKEQDATFQAWKDHGTPVPYWGGICSSERVRVCKCQLSSLAAWFRGAFVEDEAAEMEFVLFLAELSGETK
ncbi:fungal-specific transcription factor domain-containing protein [Daldinia vernicosa]|uniref:fungal-specific transcription factor domain-containing protein n=1 Tax=Daldinia vernicosa TaxID=114800 RepID=UPI002007F1AE|nr:fungal-specific transcription factor domain-containing protein [Daldinia vernicosa]KAI0848788.1 fungal-specific transcription factor domain-containing protein [Daldinia vernicosa]